jgi:hypothetical protein
MSHDCSTPTRFVESEAGKGKRSEQAQSLRFHPAFEHTEDALRVRATARVRVVSLRTSPYTRSPDSILGAFRRARGRD